MAHPHAILSPHECSSADNLPSILLLPRGPLPALPWAELLFLPRADANAKNKEQGRDKKGEYILTDMKSEVIQIGTWKDAHWT